MTNQDRQKQIKGALLHFYENPIARVSLELFLSVGLILFLGIFAIRPTLVTMSNLLQEIEDKGDLNEQLERKIAALGTAQNEYRANEQNLFVLDEAIPSDPELIRNLKIVEKIAIDSRVVIQNLGITEIPVEENVNEVNRPKSLTNLPMTITVVGNYPSIRNFVKNFHDNRRVIVVDSVTFSLEDGSDIKELSARIAFNFPYIGIAAPKSKR